MLIDIQAISHGKEAFIDIETVISQNELAGSLQDYRLVEAPEFQGRLTSSGKGLLSLNGRLQAVAEGECARCLNPVRRVLDIAVDESFRPIQSASQTGAEDSYAYEGYVVDLLPALRDNLVLALPQRILCRDDCHGLCPVCGIDLNEAACSCDRHLESGSPFDLLRRLL